MKSSKVSIKTFSMKITPKNQHQLLTETLMALSRMNKLMYHVGNSSIHTPGKAFLLLLGPLCASKCDSKLVAGLVTSHSAL